MGTLFVVATPIGNLEDITYRAIRILREVDIIAAEDTRQTRKILDHYAIGNKRLISCRAHNEKPSSKGIVKLLAQGENLAYATDAGSPGISDPGHFLVAAVRQAGYPVVPIPGASAVTALVSVSGLSGKGFLFEGFLSPKDNRRRSRLAFLLESGMNFVLYESPFRVEKILGNLVDLAPKHQICLGREISKKFEEFITGTAEEVLSQFSQRGIKKGEFSILVQGRKTS